MELCGVISTAKIVLENVPPPGTFVVITDNTGTPHQFTFVGTPTPGGTSIEVFPGETVIDIIPRIITVITDYGIFGTVYVDPTNNDIWISQPTPGSLGNRKNRCGPKNPCLPGTSGPSCVADVHIVIDGPNDEVILRITDFGGGFDDPGTPRQDTTIDDFERGDLRRRTQQARELFEDKKRIERKKQRVKNCKPLSTISKIALIQALAGLLCPCPTCSAENKVKDKVAGKSYFKIPFTEFKIPRFDHIIDKTPTFDANRREGEKCGSCGGSKKIPDPTNDSAKYQQVAQKVEQNSEKILEKEAKLGLGGTRTTLIQGSDLLFVGLGFNGNKTHEVVGDGAIAPSMKGGKIPQQNATTVNAVVGKQGGLAWPQQVGNYTIKCANKFNLLAGAGGITLATPGPLTISSGMLKITGPQVALGCANGPLTLEGQSVNISGKTIAMTPTGGELFVKGNISNTGNITTQGHAHFESASFVKAACVGINKSTLPATANPDVVSTQRATWQGKAVSAALLDIQNFYQTVPTDSKSSAFKLASPKVNQNISDRMSSMSKLCLPWEKEVTGYVIPGTTFQALINGYPCSVQIISPVDLHNFPHVHGIPEMKHTHEVYLPDMDYTNDSPDTLRDKVLSGAHESGVPQDPTKDNATRLGEVKRTAAELAATSPTEATKKAAQKVRMS